jgi:hypothetical protein
MMMITTTRSVAAGGGGVLTTTTLTTTTSYVQATSFEPFLVTAATSATNIAHHGSLIYDGRTQQSPDPTSSYY